jgi:hypothetical protein
LLVIRHKANTLHRLLSIRRRPCSKRRAAYVTIPEGHTEKRIGRLGKKNFTRHGQHTLR